MNSELLQRVIDNPGDDAPRLIYAEWLEENGEAERGEFIRVQIELENRPPVDRKQYECKVCGNWPDENGELEHGKGCYTQSEDGGGLEFIPEAIDEQAEALRARERELLDKHQWKWIQQIINRAAMPANWDWTYKRGFMDRFRCTWQDFKTHHPAIRAATPLTRCELTTRPDDIWLSEAMQRHDFFGLDAGVIGCEFPGIAFAFVGNSNGGQFIITGGAGNFSAHGGAVTIQG